MSQYSNDNIAVIGAGLTGQSCVRYLLSQGARVSVFDTRTLPFESPFNVSWGDIPIDALLSFDRVVVSPGVSLTLAAIANAISAGIEVVGDVELFARENTVPTIGVTGSNGKSTVVSLLGAIFSHAGYHVCVSGNIGTPVLNTLSDPDVAETPKSFDWYVLELSSFQLESTASLQLDIACILNISEDHLDRHLNMANYVAAKRRILAHAEQRVVCRDDSLTAELAQSQAQTFGLSSSDIGMSWLADSQQITFNGESFVNFADCSLSGLHNVLNIQAASLIALQAGVDAAIIVSAVKQFVGLPHRYQRIPTSDNIHWINDSKATNPGATQVSLIAARAETSGQVILIVGGDAKQANLSELAERIANSVSYLIALGKDGRQFMPFAKRCVFVDTLEQAVTVAASVARDGDIVLLSPACASLDMFKNYEHRGQCFTSAVEELVA